MKTNTQEQVNTKKYRWALWVGLIGWLVLGGIYLLWTKVDAQPDMLRVVKTVMPWWVICFVLPVVVEAVFRLWGIRGKATAIITCLLIPAFMWWTSGSIVLTVIALLALALCVFLVKDEDKRQLALLLLSSFFFGLWCYSCYSVSTPLLFVQTSLRVLSVMCSGLLLGYVVVNYGFLWAVLLHVLFSSALVLVNNVCYSHSGKSLSTENYSVSLAPVQKSNAPYLNSRDMKGDTLLLKDGLTMAVITFQTSNHVPLEDRNVLYVYPDITNESRYLFTVVPKHSMAEQHYEEIVPAMVAEGWIASDTSYQPQQMLQVIDADKLAAKIAVDSTMRIRDLVHHLRYTYHIPAVASPTLNMETPLAVAYAHIRDMKENEFLAYLRDELGLNLVEQPHQRMQVVKFRVR